MDRKTVRLDRRSLEELVERMRETRVDVDLDRCDMDSLTLAIRGLSQITRFAKELVFDVSSPVEEPVRMRPIPDYGDHMTLGSFLDCVQSGCFIDYDGFGEYATATQVSDKRVHPSDVAYGDIDRNYTHVVWYNR